MSNTIYRGPVANEPETLNLPVAGAYSPGICVTEDGSNLTVATAADMEAELLVLSNVRFSDQTVADAYASGDTGIAYRPKPGEVFQCRVAAATYAKGDPLTIGASGYLTAAATTNMVFAYFDGVAGAKSAGDLVDVRWANQFKLA